MFGQGVVFTSGVLMENILNQRECYLCPDHHLQMSSGLIVQWFVQNYVSSVG